MTIILAKLAAFFAGPIGRWLVVVALVSAALFAGGVYERDIGYREGLDVGAKQLEAQAKANAQAVMALDAKYRNEESAHLADVKRISTQYAIDLADSKKQADDAVAAARSGARKLYLPASTCASNERGVSNPSAGPSGTATKRGPELPAEIGANLQRLAYDANQVVLKLNMCEDILVSDRTPKGTQ